MHLSTLVDMVGSGLADRVLLGSRDEPVTGADLAERAGRGAAGLADRSALVYVGENHPLLPVALLAAAWRGIPFVPVNYRLKDAQLNALVDRQPGALVLTDPASARRITGGHDVIVLDDWLKALPVDTDVVAADDDNAVAVVLYTSGTTAAPKSALLRHRHLMAYLLNTIEFGSAGSDEAVLVAVPPYHVAGMANMLSNLFAGRRMVYLPTFEAGLWLETVRDEQVTQAMVVPTMLARIVDATGEGPAHVPTLRSLSYGGAKVAERVIREALVRFPGVGFVNAYGLTETASTIAVLGPDDHRAALAGDPAAVARLGSAGKVLPSIEIEIRDEAGSALPAGQTGLIFLRGDQIAGEYASGSLLDEHGWFCTRDRGWLDHAGYLFIEGRADDTIIRGGENIAPAEIEEVLLSHPAIVEACVVGIPDDEWGQRLAAAVVVAPLGVVGTDELRELVRDRLRSSKTPETIVFRDHLPHTETGKLLRRVVQEDLARSAEQQGA